ncbi:MAG: hypothetical protein RL701_2379, partial [Pseudomonadota bacterium]
DAQYAQTSPSWPTHDQGLIAIRERSRLGRGEPVTLVRSGARSQPWGTPNNGCVWVAAAVSCQIDREFVVHGSSWLQDQL